MRWLPTSPHEEHGSGHGQAEEKPSDVREVGHSLAAPALNRELGRWDLTAIGVNQVIGSAIFLLPGDVARQIGAWGPLAFMLVGLASLLIALCFAEAGSRFDRTGGLRVRASDARGSRGLLVLRWRGIGHDATPLASDGPRSR